jgi:hypothetical protein
MTQANSPGRDPKNNLIVAIWQFIQREQRLLSTIALRVALAVVAGTFDSNRKISLANQSIQYVASACLTHTCWTSVALPCPRKT